MGLLPRRTAGLPETARQALSIGPGDRLVAWAHDAQSDGYVVATTRHLSHVSAQGALAWQRPWHEVDQGTWQGDSALLTVTWVDGRRPAQWLLREPGRLPETLRERVQASVVLADEFRVMEGRRRVRVVIRQDLAGGPLVEQVVPGKGVDASDPEIAREAGIRLARLRSQVGL